MPPRPRAGISHFRIAGRRETRPLQDVGGRGEHDTRHVARLRHHALAGRDDEGGIRRTAPCRRRPLSAAPRDLQRRPLPHAASRTDVAREPTAMPAMAEGNRIPDRHGHHGGQSGADYRLPRGRHSVHRALPSADDRHRTVHPATRHPTGTMQGGQRGPDIATALHLQADVSVGTDSRHYGTGHTAVRRQGKGNTGGGKRGDAKPVAGSMPLQLRPV